MGRYIDQTESRSELQQRIAADLRAKIQGSSKQDDPTSVPEVDSIESSQYLKGTKPTTTLAPAWIFIILMAIGVFALFVHQVSR